MVRFYKRLSTIFDWWVEEFTHVKGGYKVWQDVSQYQKVKIKKRVIESWFSYLFHDDFKLALFFAMMTDAGTPTLRGRRLYIWTVDILYGGSEVKLFNDWVRLVKHEKL